MPNWTENELTITGPDIQKVLNAIRSVNPLDEDTQILDFDRIIPYPDEFKALDLRNVEYQGKFYAIDSDDPARQAKLETLGAEYGVEPGTPWLKDGYNSGGYDWCCDQWGTKWNASHPTLELRPDGSAFIAFDTAWSPPIPVIEKLAEMFPDHQFDLEYFEGGMGFRGQALYENGSEAYHDQGEYSGPRGG